MYHKFEYKYLLCAPITLVVLIYFHFLMKMKPWFPLYKKNIILGIIDIPFYIFLVFPFIILDVLYNWTVGTVLFGFPKTWLFTDRMKRLHPQGVYDTDRLVRILNEIDPGHV